MLGLISLEYIQTRLLLRKIETSGAKFGSLQQRPSSIHDRWLVVRVTVPLVFLSAFEGYNIVVQVTYNHMDISDSLTAEPDLTAGKAQSTIAAFIPGCVAGLFLLICFGTTRQFRRKLYKTFVPVQFQRARSDQSMTSSRASYAASKQLVITILTPSRRTPPPCGICLKGIVTPLAPNKAMATS